MEWGLQTILEGVTLTSLFALGGSYADLDFVRLVGENIAWAAAILVAIGVIWKSNWVGRPIKWVWKRLVSEPMASWSRNVIGAVVEEKIDSSPAIRLQGHFQKRVDDSLHDQADFRHEIRAKVLAMTEASTATTAGLDNIHSCLDRRFTETQAQIDRIIVESSGNRDRIRQMYDIQDAIVFETDASGNFTYFNPAFSLVTGLTSQEALGGGWSHVIHADDQPRVFKSWADAHRDDRPFTEVFRLKNIFGKQDICVSATASPLKDGLGKSVGWVGAATLLTPEADDATMETAST